MKKIIKWILLVFVVLVIFILAAPFIFKNKIVATIKEEANKNINAKFDFADFDITLIKSFPDLQFSLQNFYIAGVDSFANDTLIAAKELAINLNVMSVIKGSNYEIKKIALNEANIKAKILKSGKANWDILKASSEPEKTEQASSSAFKMSLKKLKINNTKLVYIDEQLGFETYLTNLQHELSGDFTQDDFVLETITNIEEFSMLYGGVKYLNKTKTNIKANLEANMPNFKFTFKDNEIQINNLFLAVNGWFAMPKEDMEMDLTINALKTDFKNILSLIPSIYAKDFESVKASGKLALDARIKGIYNDKSMPAYNLKLLVENAMFQYPSLPKSANNININVVVDNKNGQPDNTTIDINKFHVEMAGNPLDVVMHVATPVSDPFINGFVKGKVDLTSIKDIIPLDKGDDLNGLITADVTLKGKMSSIEKEKYEEFNAAGTITVAEMNYKTSTLNYPIAIKTMGLNFTPKFVELTQFNSKMGKSDIQANGKIENFLQYALKDELIKGNFNLTSSFIDLNELMGPEETSASATDTTAMEVVEVPSNIDFVLNSDIKKVMYDNMEMTNLKGVVVVNNSKASMKDVKLNMLDGSMAVNGSYDTKTPKKPLVDFNLAINDFDLPKTYKTFNTIEKLAPIAKYCSGKFSTSIKFVSDLDAKMEPVLSTLTGDGKLQTKNVVVSNFMPMVKVAEITKMDKYKSLSLTNTNISFKFKDGKVNIDPFDVKLGNSIVNIGGSNGFDQSINYTMNFDIPTSELGSVASMANGLLSQIGAGSIGDRIKLSALVGGTVTKPTVKLTKVGSSESIKDDLKNKAKEELENKKKELESKARAEADKLKQEAEAKIKSETERIKKEAEAKAKLEAERLKKEAEQKLKEQAKDKLKGLLKKP